MAVNSKQLMKYVCKTPWTKAESLYFIYILFYFKASLRVQWQILKKKKKKSIFVQQIMDLSVFIL